MASHGIAAVRPAESSQVCGVSCTVDVTVQNGFAQSAPGVLPPAAAQLMRPLVVAAYVGDAAIGSVQVLLVGQATQSVGGCG
jgi:hypothetical protein